MFFKREFLKELSDAIFRIDSGKLFQAWQAVTVNVIPPNVRYSTSVTLTDRVLCSVYMDWDEVEVEFDVSHYKSYKYLFVQNKGFDYQV